MQHSFLGLVFNITVLILEYKRAAFAQTLSLGYKPVRPSYFNPDHPGHHPGQIISPGWFWPVHFSSTTGTSTTVRTTTSTVQVPNGRPDLPQQGGELPLLVDYRNTEMVNHWFRPVIITSTLGNEKKTTQAPTLSTTSTWTQAPSISTVSGSPQLQFLPEGDLFTSAPVLRNSIENDHVRPSTLSPISSTTAPSTLSSTLIESTEINVTLAVADLLPLPIDYAKNESVNNLNLLLPVLPLKASNIN